MPQEKSYLQTLLYFRKKVRRDPLARLQTQRLNPDLNAEEYSLLIDLCLLRQRLEARGYLRPKA